jgi:DNA polymerase III alpha subunit
MEFEAFGFYLKNHPLDMIRTELGSKGITFFGEIEDSVGDNSLIRMAGVVISVSIRSGGKGRYAYLMISDPTGLAELSLFSSDMIARHRDLLDDKMHSHLVFECSIRRDDSGLRISARDLWPLDQYLKNTRVGEPKVRKMRAPSGFSQRNGGNYEGKRPLARTGASENIREKRDTPVKKLNIHIFSEECVEELFSIVNGTRDTTKTEYTDISIIADGKTIKLPREFRISESEIAKIREIYGINGLEIS